MKKLYCYSEYAPEKFNRTKTWYATEQEILDFYYDHWATLMERARASESAINKETCITDFCTVHWADEIVGLKRMIILILKKLRFYKYHINRINESNTKEIRTR